MLDRLYLGFVLFLALGFACVVGILGITAMSASAQETQPLHSAAPVVSSYKVGPSQYIVEIQLKDGTRCLLYGASGITCNWKKEP